MSNQDYAEALRKCTGSVSVTVIDEKCGAPATSSSSTCEMNRVKFNEIIRGLTSDELCRWLEEIEAVDKIQPADGEEAVIEELIRVLNIEYTDEAIATLTEEDITSGFAI